MATVNTYLNFDGKTEEAFNFYKSVFGTEFENEFQRMGDVPPAGDQPPVPDNLKNQIMHVSLPITDGHLLMGSDAPEYYTKRELIMGNNVYISLSLDSRGDVDRLFGALSAGGSVEAEPDVMFWGDYYAACADKFGVRWMFNCSNKE